MDSSKRYTQEVQYHLGTFRGEHVYAGELAKRLFDYLIDQLDQAGGVAFHVGAARVLQPMGGRMPEDEKTEGTDQQPNPLIEEMHKILADASQMKFVQGTAHYSMTDPTLNGKPLEQAVRYVASRIRSVCKS